MRMTHLIYMQLQSILFPDDKPQLHAIRVSDNGSQLCCIQVEIQGVLIVGLVDSGTDISIISGEVFKNGTPH